jgi:hypothetical protein
MNPMDFFKIKNNLMVGKNAIVSGDLFVSGKIIQGELPNIDGGTPSSDFISAGDNSAN